MFGFKESTIFVKLELFVPEGSDIDPSDLWCTQDLPERPHECTIHPHQLLCVDHVGFVQDDANLMLVSFHEFYHSSKLVGNIKFVGVEEENDHVRTIGKPRNHSFEIIASVQPLLLPGEDTGCVDQREAVQDGAGHVGGFQLAEEIVAEVLESSKLELWVDSQRVARRHLLVGALHYSHESVGGRLGSDSNAGEVFLQEVANECGLSRGVLPEKQHHRLSVEVAIAEVGRMELPVLVGLLERAEFLPVDFLQSVDDVLVDLRLLLFLVPAHPGEHVASTPPTESMDDWLGQGRSCLP